MSVMQRLLPIALLVLVSTTSVTAKDWRGILPLHSTREDVEALLGPPPPPPNDRSYALHKGRSIYFVEESEVYIVFADEEFLGRNQCPSVATGTVLMIQVTPKDGEAISKLILNEKVFRKFDPSEPPDVGFDGFIDEQEGLVIGAIQGKVQVLVYLPSASDRARCPSYYEKPERFVQIRGGGCFRAFDEYGDIRFSDEKARLDNFAIQLLNDESARGHIIVYAGRKATVAEAQIRANRALDYLTTVRKIDPQRVKAVDGGYREELTVHLYIIPSGAEPPESMPMIDPSQVEIIYEKKRRPQRKQR